MSGFTLTGGMNLGAMILSSEGAPTGPMELVFNVNLSNPTVEVPITNQNGSEYTVTVDWGDGTVINYGVNATLTHTYTTAGLKTVTVSGTATGANFGSSGSINPWLTRINSWGNLGFASGGFAFRIASNVEYVAQPPFNDFSGLFAQAGSGSFTADITGWDTGNVTNMTSMFDGASTFNQNLSGWCVTNIATEPNNFATGSLLAPANKPIWGTCPSGPPVPITFSTSLKNEDIVISNNDSTASFSPTTANVETAIALTDGVPQTAIPAFTSPETYVFEFTIDSLNVDNGSSLYLGLGRTQAGVEPGPTYDSLTWITDPSFQCPTLKFTKDGSNLNITTQTSDDPVTISNFGSIAYNPTDRLGIYILLEPAEDFAAQSYVYLGLYVNGVSKSWTPPPQGSTPYNLPVTGPFASYIIPSPETTPAPTQLVPFVGFNVSGVGAQITLYSSMQDMLYYNNYPKAYLTDWPSQS